MTMPWWSVVVPRLPWHPCQANQPQRIWMVACLFLGGSNHTQYWKGGEHSGVSKTRAFYSASHRRWLDHKCLQCSNSDQESFYGVGRTKGNMPAAASLGRYTFITKVDWKMQLPVWMQQCYAVSANEVTPQVYSAYGYSILHHQIMVYEARVVKSWVTMVPSTKSDGEDVLPILILAWAISKGWINLDWHVTYLARSLYSFVFMVL